MRKKSKFAFFRATYYRWAQLFPSLLPELMDAPKITAIGDLHLENFGTFRTPNRQLEWGVNDFDEADVLPYTNDIVRLAASALMAISENKLAIKPAKACKAILEGYTKRINKGKIKRFILDKRKEPFLTKLVKNSFDDDESFWRNLLNTPYIDTKNLPSAAIDLLKIVSSAGDGGQAIDTYPEVFVHRRVAGLGSLGHRRYVAINSDEENNKRKSDDVIDDVHTAHELKELGPPATFWLNKKTEDSWSKNSPLLQYSINLTDDPSRNIKENWLIRRIAPDCVKLELSMISPKRKEHLVLLNRMGAETANIHLATKNAEAMQNAILNDLRNRSSQWLIDASMTMIQTISTDWQLFRETKK